MVYEEQWLSAKAKTEDAQKRRQSIDIEVARAATKRDQIQREQLDTLRTIADLEGNQQRTTQQIDGVRRLLQDLTQRRDSTQADLVISRQELAGAEQELVGIESSLQDLQKQIDLSQSAIEDHRRLLTRRRDEVAALKVRLQGVAERIHVLEDLQRRQEGLSGGIRSLLEMTREAQDESDRGSRGLGRGLDSIGSSRRTVGRCALGERTQYAVVRGDRLQQAIIAGDLQLAGRVGLIRLDELPPHRPGDRIRLDGLRGVIGRADRMVTVEKRLQPLLKHLLGTTWLVDTLSTAMGLRKLSGAGLRFVTSRCELLEVDGSVIVGPSGAAAGLVSRRSELLAAQEERKHYRFQLLETERRDRTVGRAFRSRRSQAGTTATTAA